MDMTKTTCFVKTTNSANCFNELNINSMQQYIQLHMTMKSIFGLLVAIVGKKRDDKEGIVIVTLILIITTIWSYWINIHNEAIQEGNVLLKY